MEKQIEEMAKIIRCKAEQLPRCPHTTCSICKATELYNAGYRKASDVAEEIFAELELKAPFFCENQIAYEHFYEELAELKKKYAKTEGGE